MRSGLPAVIRVRVLTISRYDVITDKTQITEQLMVVHLAVGQATPLVMPRTVKWFLALGTDKVLRMPVFPCEPDKGCYDTVGSGWGLCELQFSIAEHVGHKLWNQRRLHFKRIHSSLSGGRVRLSSTNSNWKDMNDFNSNLMYYSNTWQTAK